MERINVDGVELEVEARGSGEPVVLIHGSILADAFAPLLEQPALTGRYRLINYHRRGFAGSTHPDGPLSIAQQAADTRAVMRHLGIDRAHIAGHSYGGAIALQLALDAPGAVHSLALLEPAVLTVPSAEQMFQQIQAIMETYQAGDKQGAIEAFLQAVLGPDYRGIIAGFPGALDQAVADADTFFQIELPALQEWQFTQADAGRITQPVQFVLGAESAGVWPGWTEVRDLVRAWLPQTEVFVLASATHGLQMMNPRDMAEGLAGFLARHPLPVVA